MPIMNTVIKGGGTTPTGTKSITANGTYDVTDFASADVQVPTTAPALYREFQLDANGKLVPNTTTTHIMNFTGVTDVSDYALANAYKENANISGAVDMSDLTTISGERACNNTFYHCPYITSIILSSLTTISGASACSYMFFRCNGLTSISMPSLTTISGISACSNMFQNCIGLVSADLSAVTAITASNSCSSMFFGCTSLATVYIGGTTVIDFGTRVNQFGSMFGATNQNIDVYAPAANQTQIEAFSGYPNFGATGTVTWHWRS